VLYWIGCTVAALMAIIIGFIIYENGLDDPLSWIGCIIAAVSFAIGSLSKLMTAIGSNKTLGELPGNYCLHFNCSNSPACF
jgi:hypothetical protein